jgi:very-short-patch-repair endonuclease
MRTLIPSPSVHKQAILRERARCMRHAGTPSECALWACLRARKLGVTFRRQALVYGYILDFLASEIRLAVEVDGPWHARRPLADARRDRLLERAGYRVLRFTDEEVLRELPSVVERIRAGIAAPSP